MAQFPTFEEMAQEVAQRALDECEYEGKTLREWIDIIKNQPVLGTNLAEVSTDCISRQQAIDALERVKTATSENGERWIAKINAQMELEQLPPAQPYTIHSDGRLWVTVDDIDKVTAVVVDEHKSKFCKQFYEDYEDYEDAQPEIIRCKDCKHYWIHKCMDSMPIERCDLEQTFYDAEYDFCSLAERKEVTT